MLLLTNDAMEGACDRTLVDTAHPILAARAATHAPQVAAVRKGLASRYAVVPMQAQGAVCADRLRALVGRTPALT